MFTDYFSSDKISSFQRNTIISSQVMQLPLMAISKVKSPWMLWSQLMRWRYSTSVAKYWLENPPTFQGETTTPPLQNNNNPPRFKLLVHFRSGSEPEGLHLRAKMDTPHPPPPSSNIASVQQEVQLKTECWWKARGDNLRWTSILGEDKKQHSYLIHATNKNWQKLWW